VCAAFYWGLPAYAQNAKPQTHRTERLEQFLGLGPAPDAAAAARGATTYASNCSFCHGVKATGGEGPDLVRSSLVLHDQKGELIGQVVKNGRPDKGMPAFPSLTEAQISDIAAFLHMKIYEAANRGTYQIQNVVTGDAKAGEAFFNGPGGCTACHSVTGDLAHVASKYQPVELQAAFLYPAAVSRLAGAGGHQLPTPEVTVTLSSGQSYTGKLKRLDDFVVSLYDSAGNYHSWTRGPGVTVTVKDPLTGHLKLLGQYTDADMHNVLAYLVTLK
jgi:mono/diheme cytochrome c family protein